MRKIAIIATVVLAVSATLMAQYGGGVSAKDNPPAMRTLQGRVLGTADAPLAEAIVYLKNTKNLTVRTFIAEKDGGYRFTALSPNIDYEVFAEYKGKKSDTKTLSSFDGRRTATINLKIDAGQ